MTVFERPVLLEIEELSTDFLTGGEEAAHALSHVSLQLHEGEVLGVVGESGCGKTTLMLSLMRLLPAAGRITTGRINFMNQDLLSFSEKEMAAIRWQEIAMIFQGAMNALNPVRTIGDQIAEAIVRHKQLTDKKAVAQRVGELLDLVGIRPERQNQYPHQYSGGITLQLLHQ